jgi:hypothetical protein
MNRNMTNTFGTATVTGYLDEKDRGYLSLYEHGLGINEMKRKERETIK